MASIDIMLRKLAYIHTVCDDARKEKKAEEADKKTDNFTRQKKKIAAEIREVKLVRFFSSTIALGQAISGLVCLN